MTARVPQLKNTAVVPVRGESLEKRGERRRSRETLAQPIKGHPLMTAIIAKLHVEVKLTTFEEFDDLLQCVFIVATDSN